MSDNPDGGPPGAVLARRERSRTAKRSSRARNVFISYRHEDASGYAGRLHDALTRHFGPKRVFRDTADIPAGTDFADLINESLRSCGAMVVVIGREWAVDTKGRRRLDDPDDWVRTEVAVALGRDDVLVVPVLVEGVSLPGEDDLPDVLLPLLRRQAVELSEERWEYDVQRVTGRLEEAVGPAGWHRRLGERVRPRSAAGWAVRAAAVTALLVAAAVVASRLSDRAPAPRPMSGDFNIAVAEFSAVDARGRAVASEEAVSLAESVHQRLAGELDSIASSGFALELRAPRETGQISGRTAIQRAEAAAAEAKRIRADIVVYGTLRVDVPTQFTTEFYVSERSLASAEELIGQHELGSTVTVPADISRNAVARREVREALLGRAKALAEFVVGLSYFAVNQDRPALDHFRAAQDSPGWADRDGKEVVHLFVGSAAGRLGDLDAAQAAYDQALALNPEYARARLGVAEVLLHRSRGTCEAGSADPAGLNRALDRFQAALVARVQPVFADIPTKVTFGVGRVHLCLSQALAADHWSEAEHEFQQIVDEHARGNPRIRQLAAESHANLGFVHLPAAGDADAPAQYRRALADYEKAVELTLRNDRKAFFLSMQGFILSRLGDRGRAEAAYVQAILFEPDPAKKATYDEARRSLK